MLVFLVAAAQVSSPLDFDLASIADPIAGIVLMFIAAFAPYMTYRFISFMGIDLHHAVSAEQESKAAVGRPAPVSAQQLAGLATVVGGPAAATAGAARVPWWDPTARPQSRRSADPDAPRATASVHLKFCHGLMGADRCWLRIAPRGPRELVAQPLVVIGELLDALMN